MRGWRRLIAACFCGAWGLMSSVRSAPFRRILLYHAIGTAIPEDTKGLYTLAPSLFSAQMRLIVDGRVPVVPLGDHIASAGSCVITFDDGYRDNLTVAAPVLRDNGFPFTVFVCRDFVRSGDPIYLDVGLLRELAALPGVTIGCHGASHRPLTSCSDLQLADELVGSRAWLEDIIQKPVDSMSYPHGAVDRRVRDAVAAAGFRIAVTSRFGATGRQADPLLLSRTDIWSTDRQSDFQSKVEGNWDWVRLVR